MIWIIISCLLYALIAAVALFLICSSEDSSIDSYFDIRNIGVAIFWPLVLSVHGLWRAGNMIFKEKNKTAAK